MSVFGIFGTRFYFVNVMNRLAGLGVYHASIQEGDWGVDGSLFCQLVVHLV